MYARQRAFIRGGYPEILESKYRNLRLRNILIGHKVYFQGSGLLPADNNDINEACMMSPRG